MRIFCKTFASMFVALTFAAGSAGAVTFNFAGDRADLGAMIVPIPEIDGIGLTVTSSGGNIHQNNSGFGVVGAPAGNRMAGSETLMFAFSPGVRLLESVVFEKGGGIDTVQITVGSTVVGTFDVGDGTGDNSRLQYDLSGLNLAGDFFTFQVISDPSEGIRIRELTVAAIPLPATLTLLAFAFGGLAFAARRRKQRSA